MEESVSHVSETQEVNELDESSSPVRREVRNQHADPSGSNLSSNLGSQFHANANTHVNQVNSRDGSNPLQYVSNSHGSQHQTNATTPMNQVNSRDTSGQTRQYEQHRQSGSSSRFVDSEGFERVSTRSQIRNYRKKQRRSRLRNDPVPYGLRSRAHAADNL